MATLRITRGIPGSGKSTFAKAWVDEAPGRLRLNRDNARDLFFGKRQGLTGDQENVITDHLLTIAERSLLDGVDVIYDATNTIARHIKPWIKVAHKVGAKIVFHDFEISLDEALFRNAVRPDEERLPDDVVRKFYSRLGKGGKLNPAPDVTPKFDTAWREYVGDESLPTAYICDIDGTLADMNGNGRSPYDMTRVEEDEVKQGTLDLITYLASTGIQIVYLSGRNDKGRIGTTRWLHNLRAPEGPLFMRPDGDMRPDDVLKHELVWQDVAPHWNIKGAIDDRHSILRLWHAMGIPAFGVAHPDLKEF